MYWVSLSLSLSGINRRRCGVDHLLSSSAEVKETVDIYVYFSPEPSWAVLG
jgi:hypothetical protein